MMIVILNNSNNDMILLLLVLLLNHMSTLRESCLPSQIPETAEPTPATTAGKWGRQVQKWRRFEHKNG